MCQERSYNPCGCLQCRTNDRVSLNLSSLEGSECWTDHISWGLALQTETKKVLCSNLKCSAHVCLSLLVCPCPWLHGIELKCKALHSGRTVIVLNLAPSFSNQKEDFLCWHCKWGRTDCGSAPVFLLLRIQSCYCTTSTECTGFTKTVHPNKAQTDLCQVPWPTSINLKISSWFS